MAATSFSNKSNNCKASNATSNIDIKYERIVNILLQEKSNEFGIDDHKKLRILRELTTQNQQTEE